MSANITIKALKSHEKPLIQYLISMWQFRIQIQTSLHYFPKSRNPD